MEEPEKMLRIGGYSGITLAILATLSSLLYLMYLMYILSRLTSGDIGIIIEVLTYAIIMIIVAGVSTVLSGLLYILFGLGFQGGAKKFDKGIGTGAFVMALLAGIFLMITGFGVIGLLATLAAGEFGAASIAFVMIGVGMVLYGFFAFIFDILAIIYFFSTEQGTIGGVGGILVLIGQLISLAVVGIGHIIVLIGLILMGICLLNQSKL